MPKTTLPVGGGAGDRTQVGPNPHLLYPSPGCRRWKKDLEASPPDSPPSQPLGPRVSTCSGELVGHLLPHGLGEVEVVVVLVDAAEEERDVLEDDSVLAMAPARDAQLLVQPLVLCLLQGGALGGIVPELGVEDEEQDAPDPEAEIVVPPGPLELCHSLGRGGVAHVVVAADQHQRDVTVHARQHPLQVRGLLLPPGHPCKREGHS